jgi:hypothetical protein
MFLGIGDTMTTVTAAQATLQDLLGQRQAAERHVADLAAVRGRVAYAATAGGDKAARKELDKATADALQAQLEDNLDAAIEEARRRIAAAEAAQQRAQREADARAALEVAAELREAAQLAGEASIALIARIARARELVGEAHRLGLGLAPRDEVVRSYIGRILGHALYPVTGQGLLPPSDRQSLEASFVAYGQMIERGARQILGEHTEDEAA